MDSSAYRAIFDAATDSLFVHDMQGRIVLVNARACAMIGGTREQLLELNIGQLSANEPGFSQERALGLVHKAIDEGQCSFEWRSRRLNGEPFWTEVALRSFELEERMHVIACVRDIDARKRMEAELSESEERFAKIFNATSTMLAFTDVPRGRLIDVNHAWLRAVNIPREDVLGKTGAELGLWVDVADRAAIIDALDRHGRVHEAETKLCMGGRVLPARISAEYIEMRGERYVLWEIGDLSERKQAERQQEELRTQLLQSQKMESIGRLAGGIAHDFNNMLSAILGFGELARQELEPSSSPVAEYLSEMIRAGERAGELTKQLLAFSRKQVMQPKIVDPTAVLRAMQPMLGRLIGEDIELKLALSAEASPIRVDVTHLEQAILNLVVNARDAMPEGGTLTLETANVELDSSQANRHGEVLPGPHVMIAVSDTGAGMDAATQARVFEPFFTTKGPGKGTGLGLATVYGIVKQSGGFVWLYSELGRGTTFKLYFPPSTSPVLPPAAREQAQPRAQIETVVLLVEDDPQVRLLVATVLVGAGYTVLIANGPREALELSEGYAGAIDLLLTDVVMPEMNGRQLADKICQKRPATRVMYVSGYTENTVVHRGELDPGVNFLSKPITVNRLLAMVSRVVTG